MSESDYCSGGSVKSCEKWHPKIRRFIERHRIANPKLKFKVSDLMKDLNCTRPTIDRHRDFINAEAQRLFVYRRLVDGKVGDVHAREKLDRMAEQMRLLMLENQQLRTALIVCFDALMIRNVDPRSLKYLPVLVEEAKCYVCGRPK